MSIKYDKEVNQCFQNKLPQLFTTVLILLGLIIHDREVKQNLLCNVPAADSHPNYFGISPYWRNLFLTGCATSSVA